jgi:plastocyanin
MRLLLISIFVVFLVVLLTPNAFGATQLVIIPYGSSNGNNFNPSIIEIQKDDTVKWVNLDRNTAHTVTSTSGLFDSGELLPNNDENYCYPNCKPSLTYKFDAGGTYKYECKIHSWDNSNFHHCLAAIHHCQIIPMYLLPYELYFYQGLPI